MSFKEAGDQKCRNRRFANPFKRIQKTGFSVGDRQFFAPILRGTAEGDAGVGKKGPQDGCSRDSKQALRTA